MLGLESSLQLDGNFGEFAVENCAWNKFYLLSKESVSKVRERNNDSMFSRISSIEK